MGAYTEHFLPHFQDIAMRRKTTRHPRARVCADLRGDVLEVGFGTGLNTRYYPPSVTKVLAVEPSAVCMRVAQSRIASSTVTVENAGLTGERLEVESESMGNAPSHEAPPQDVVPHRRWRDPRQRSSTPIARSGEHRLDCRVEIRL